MCGKELLMWIKPVIVLSFMCLCAILFYNPDVISGELKSAGLIFAAVSFFGLVASGEEQIMCGPICKKSFNQPLPMKDLDYIINKMDWLIVDLTLLDKTSIISSQTEKALEKAKEVRQLLEEER